MKTGKRKGNRKTGKRKTRRVGGLTSLNKRVGRIEQQLNIPPVGTPPVGTPPVGTPPVGTPPVVGTPVKKGMLRTLGNRASRGVGVMALTAGRSARVLHNAGKVFGQASYGAAGAAGGLAGGIAGSFMG